jgi:hypothetical protein
LEDQAFANLERVIMTGAGDRSWGEQTADYKLPFDQYHQLSWQDKLANDARKFDIRPIPHFLIGLDTVKHYCQTALAGPLALANEILRPPNLPEIVTYHLPPRPIEAGILPPMVPGAINRYVFQLCAHIRFGEGNGDVERPEAVKDILMPILEMLERRYRALCFDESHFDLLPIRPGLVNFKDTIIELYGYTRHVQVHIADGKAKFNMKRGANNLKGIQDQLDLLIAHWKGKVFLKNIEDAPPCSACGLDADAANPIDQRTVIMKEV